MAQIKLRNPFDEAATTSSAESSNGSVAETGHGQGRDPTIRLSVDLERSLHRRLRRWALERDRTASDLIRELLTSALDTAGY
jgi:hypothetical protein